MERLKLVIACVLLAAANGAQAQGASIAKDAHKHCTRCEEWNRPVEPFRIFGNTYYVGVGGLSSVLVTGDKGHTLLDGALPQSAALIYENIRKLGFDPADVLLILNSHAHYDHAGGIAELQELTKAFVLASPSSVNALMRGRPTDDDPQAAFGAESNGFPPVRNVAEVEDEAMLGGGDEAITVHFTPGHTPGATTWTWRSCEQSRCVDIVYADSLNAVSAPGYRFTDNPATLQALRASIDRVAALPCDILITVHPELSRLFERHDAAAQTPDAFIDKAACQNYAKAATATLERRLQEEKAKR